VLFSHALAKKTTAEAKCGLSVSAPSLLLVQPHQRCDPTVGDPALEMRNLGISGWAAHSPRFGRTA